jgi:glutathione S-transferase
MITIYNFPRGARGLRVAWLCEEMGLPYKVEPVTYPVSDAYRAKTSLGAVPFLEDGKVAMNESAAMMIYLAEKYGPTPLLPPKEDPRYARVIQMTVFSEATFGAGMNTLMMAHFGAPETDKKNWSVRMQEDASAAALRFAEEILGDNAYLAGDDLTIADMTLVTGFGMWKGVLGKDIPPKFLAYRERATARPAYQRAMTANGNK